MREGRDEKETVKKCKLKEVRIYWRESIGGRKKENWTSKKIVNLFQIFQMELNRSQLWRKHTYKISYLFMHLNIDTHFDGYINVFLSVHSCICVCTLIGYLIL